jgi:DNA-binding NarL/FixJ family response regulator
MKAKKSTTRKSSKIKVFLADDHAVVRDGLRMILEAEGDIEVVGQAADGITAVREITKNLPDVVVMDICMPEMNGIDATRHVMELCKNVRIVMLSVVATSEHVYQALSVGALGYVLKDSAADEVVKAVRSVHKGKRFLSEEIAETVTDAFVSIREQTSYQSPLERLSHREREVLHLVVDGKSSGEIAETLSLSPKTVDTYRSRLMDKLGVKGVPGLVKFAIEHGLTTLN